MANPAGPKKNGDGSEKTVGADPAASTKAAQSEQPPGGTWPPSRFSVWSERWGNPNDDSQTYPTTVLLRHPSAPFTRPLGSVDSLEHDLKKIAYDYLVAANSNPLIDPPLALPTEWLDALDPDGPGPTPSLSPPFQWLPIGWPTNKPQVSSLVSFLAPRTNASDQPNDLMAIMLASQPTGPGFGIRVVAHIRTSGSGAGPQLTAHISGMSASLPFGQNRPAPPPRQVTRAARARDREATLPVTPSMLLDFLTSPLVKSAVAAPLGLESSSVSFRGLRFAPIIDAEMPEQLQVEYNGTGKTKDGRNSTPYSFVVSTTFRRTPDGTPVQGPLAVISKIELVADAWTPTPGYARVFPRDPASQPDPGSPGGPGQVHKRRPTRTQEQLDRFRCEEQITPTGTDSLEFPLPATAPEDVVVTLCPGFVLGDPPNSSVPKKVDLPDTGPDRPFIRSNDFAAINALKNVRQFFLRLEAYGILPSLYFRIAKLPLKVFYRSGIRPGPGKDGQTVNARVLAEGFSVNFEGPTPPGERPGLELHLALADLSTRRRTAWNGTDRSPAEPLGIAADARWIWHEIGHVLLMASVGELQFRFAHSPGDALAAIVSDPRSTLATDVKWRGATFPWVFLPRRHDRCVAHGWGWGGGLHYALSQVEDSAGPRRKAYWSEQILSSSLFRLYRCIGGDTMQVGTPDQPDIDVRESASHYSVYLIMRGIQILGTSVVVPANEPDQFVSTLIDADINTGAWDVTFTPEYCAEGPPQQSLQLHRIGGCVHKVIRWAFEAQGLYTPPGTMTNALGAPPPVDVYIADRRPSWEANPLSGNVDYGPGSYNPVSLAWDRGQSETGPTPDWQATAHAVRVQGNTIKIRVANRGTQTAVGVNVSVWWCKWPANTEPPRWNDVAAGWTQCNPHVSPAQNINPGHEAEFDFSHTPPVNRYVVLAKATCADDPANTDVPVLACSHLNTPLVELVSGDNNIGLRVLKSP